MRSFLTLFPGKPRKVSGFAYSYLGDKAEAEDVVMESMIALWEKPRPLEENGNLHALLLTIIKNKALHVLEHKQVRLRKRKKPSAAYNLRRTGLTHLHYESLRTGPDIQHGNTAYRK